MLPRIKLTKDRAERNWAARVPGKGLPPSPGTPTIRYGFGETFTWFTFDVTRGSRPFDAGVTVK